MPRRVSAAALALFAGSLHAQTYSVTDLGEAVPGGGSYAFNIIDSGLITGTVPQDPTCNPCHTHAFREIANHVADLGIPTGASPPDSEAYALNAANQIVGRSASAGYYTPVLNLPAPAYNMPTGWNLLPQFTGGVNSQAWGINDMGQVAGEARMAGQFGPVPVLWNFNQGAWQLQNLGTLGGSYGRARSVNNLGQAVGQASEPAGALTPFIYLPAPAYGLPSGMTALDSQLRSGDVFAINAQGQAAGEIYPAPMVWLPDPAMGLPAGMTILDMSDLSGLQFAFAYGVNANSAVGQLGQLIGSTTFYYGFIWQNGHARLLHTLVDPAYHLTIIDARGINASGQIAATGYFGTNAADARALVLSPQPACYPNCDRSTTAPILNINDFSCFLNAFAAGDGYANCDSSTTPPVLNVLDFVCFLNRFAAGCS
jgi:uncharacterized membrane protein